jgi:hypothetical protein
MQLKMDPYLLNVILIDITGILCLILELLIEPEKKFSL